MRVVSTDLRKYVNAQVYSAVALSFVGFCRSTAESISWSIHGPMILLGVPKRRFGSHP